MPKQLNYPAPKDDPVVNTDQRLYWLDTAVTVTTTVTTVAWTTFDCTDDVPEGATSVLIEIEYAKSGAGTSRIDFRKRANTLAVLGATSGSGSGCNQFLVPVLSSRMKRSFDYEVTGASFTTTLSVKILGYLK